MASAALTKVADWLGAETVDPALAIRDIYTDSRQVGVGDGFIALPGASNHGRDYVQDAVGSGAAAIVVDASEALPADTGVPVLPVPRLKERLGDLAHRFYAPHTRELKVLGVTGTNGKTSVSHMLAQLLAGLGEHCAVVGTLGWGFVDRLEDTGMTTPDVVSVHRILAALAQDKANVVAMEVSSHGLEQGRVDGVEFTAAVFTNLSRDHLDYHGDMANYAACKRSLFLKPMAISAFNIDDATGAALYGDGALSAPRLSYAIADREADVYCRSVDYHPSGCDAQLVTPWGEGRLSSALLGPFNLSNTLACITLLAGLGTKLSALLPLVPHLVGPPGRMELVHDGEVRVLVDYAHTPDALAKALAAVRPHVEGKLCLVFGCGGDRDRGKRPQMGERASQGADRIVLTSDNPRNENPEAIMEAVRAGISSGVDLYCEADRGRAIEQALDQAEAGDLVLVAGKGHEAYQEIGGVRTPFSDRETIRNYYGKTGL